MSNNISPGLYETLKRLVNGDEENFEMEFHSPNKKGEGTNGEVIFITLKNKKTHKELNVIVKQPFKIQGLRNVTPVRSVYQNEIDFYSKILPTLDKFQEQIPMKYRFQKVPKCYATGSDEGYEYIVLENLKFKDFQIHNKRQPLGKEYYELIMKEFGKFHALSFAFKALHPEEYADLTKEVLDFYSHMAKADIFQKGIKYSYGSCIECLQPGVDDAVIQMLQPYLQNHKVFMQGVADSKTEYSAITHGDCCSYNMMFKYDDSKTLTDIMMFDFQLIRDSSPCCDLSYAIYSGASKEVLQNLDYYLQVYHDSLSETLKQFGCDPDKLYPLQELKKDWKIFCKLGVTMSLIVWKMKFTYDSELKSVTELEVHEHEKVFLAGYDKDAYSKVVKDLAYHLYENDFM